MKDKDLLKQFIHETLSESSRLDEIGLSDIFGFSFGKKQSRTGSWFSDFLKKKLDVVSDAASDYVSSKLSKHLPDKMMKRSGGIDREETGDILSYTVDQWARELESKGKKFSRSQKRELYDLAAAEYAEAIRKSNDQNKAIIQVYRALNSKYGSKI